MPTYLLLHPLLSGVAIILMYAAFTMKSGRTKLRYAHYAAGLTAWVLLATAVSIGIVNTARYLNQGGEFAFTLNIHLILGFAVLLTLTAQAVMGGLMWHRVQNIPRLLRWHRYTAFGLIGAVTLQALIGLWTLGSVMTVSGAVIGLAGVGLLLMAVVVVLYRRDRQTFSSQQVERIDAHTIRLDGASHDAVTVSYLPDEVQVQTPPTSSILQTSLQAGIPHTHICGGNARCSTCRVMVVSGLAALGPRNPREQSLADRLQFDDSIRLACQAQVQGNVRVRRLVLDATDAQLTSQVHEGATPGPVGQERTLAILFADIRGFTTFSEGNLPYDVVHALNRYYQAIDRAITSQGGVINNYMGDGIMVLFGLEDEAEVELRAIRAGLGMLDALHELRPYLQDHYNHTFEIGIGIHHGHVVIGDVGAPGNKRLTAIGDPVNLASRIEGKTKTVGASLLISADTYQNVAEQVIVGQRAETEIKGKTGLYTLYEVTGVRS